MRIRSTRLHSRPSRGGFTLIELLVVISIIAVLASLILPGVQNAREAARRTQCINNQRNLGTAIQNYATANRGQLPPLTGGFGINFGTGPAGSGGVFRPAPWSVHILPYLEQTGLYDRLQQSFNPDGPDSAQANSTNGLASVSIESLACPNDDNRDAPGGKTYVVNAGFMPATVWSQNNNTNHRLAPAPGGDPETRYTWPNTGFSTARDHVRATAASGVFWREFGYNDPTLGDQDGNRQSLTGGIRMTLDQISGNDGLSQTIFMSENLQARPFEPATGVGGWISQFTDDLAFGFPIPDDGENPVNVALAPEMALGVGGRINEDLEATGTRPRPSSYHPGVVVTLFGDNSVRTISQNIDLSVYAMLLTPNGNRYGQRILSSSDY